MECAAEDAGVCGVARRDQADRSAENNDGTQDRVDWVPAGACRQVEKGDGSVDTGGKVVEGSKASGMDVGLVHVQGSAAPRSVVSVHVLEARWAHGSDG